MSTHEHDTAELRALADALQQLSDFTALLEAHAQGAAHALTGSWRGVASGEFINLVSLWSAGASTLRLGASDLAEWVSGAAVVYDSAQEQAEKIWQG